MNVGDDEYEALCETLRGEASEQVESIGRLVVRLETGLEGDERKQAIDEAFRHAHNLKGAAGSLGFSATAELAHGIESLLELLRGTEEGREPPDVFDLLHSGLSAVPEALAADPGADTHPIVIEVAHRTDTLAKAMAAPARPPRKPTRRPPRDRFGPNERSARRPPSIDLREDPIEEEPTPAHTPSATGDADVATGVDAILRVKSKKLDALMAQVGELLSTRSRAEQRLSELRELLVTEESRLERLRASRGGQSNGDHMVRVVDRELESESTLVRRLRELVRALESDALHASILSGELQEDIRRIRTFPLSSTLNPLHRAVRNMAREAGKSVELQVEGADVELDKKVLSALKEPIHHILRNAVDHGIEDPATRRREGKPERGLIRVRAVHQGNTITIQVSDDGAGVDVERVRKAVVQRGVLRSDQAAEATEKQLIDLLFTPGMTTRSETSSLSGRGVGLDAVRSMIEDLRGTVVLESDRGRGSTITVALPVTVYVVHALLARIGNNRFALPISAVRRILRVRPEEVLMVEHSSAIIIEGQPWALLDLGSLLDIDTPSPAESGERFPAIVVGLGRERFAIAVDEILGDDILLAKNFEPPLVRIKNLAGAAVLGDGSVVLMVNPIDLMHSVSARGLSVRPPPPPVGELYKPRILLADDTFTTRALERSVLEHAGFDVVACADGEEALSELSSGKPFDLVVSDVSMPNMTGVQLCEAMRADQRFTKVPVVLVTSLDSPDDRRRGMEAGADAYLSKGSFDHRELVSTINALLGRA